VNPGNPGADATTVHRRRARWIVAASAAGVVAIGVTVAGGTPRASDRARGPDGGRPAEPAVRRT